MLKPPADLRPVRERLPERIPLLMGAGPTPITPQVAAANGLLVNHLGPTMDGVIESVQDMVRYAMQTEARHIIGISGPSSAGLEMAAANLLGPGRRLLALVQGTFSKRMADMARGVGTEVVELHSEPGFPVAVDEIAAALDSGPFAMVSTVQGETSSGTCNPWIPEIAQLARKHDALFLVDAVCTLTTMPLPMDEWDIDIIVTGGQKGLSSIPGVSPIAFSDRAWEIVEARPALQPHWCLDAQRAWRFWGEHQYHYTAPVPGILALHEALRMICEEGLEARFERHALCSGALQASLEAMGLELFTQLPFRLNSVLAIRTPAGVDDVALRAHMEDVHGVQIAGAFGLDIFRIGQMGEQCRHAALRRTITALLDALRVQDFPADAAAALEALEAGLQGEA